MSVQSVYRDYKFWPVFLDYLYGLAFGRNAQFKADGGSYASVYDLKPPKRRMTAREHTGGDGGH